MGQRTATETLFGIVAAFIERRTWTQAELARKLETRPETIRRQLGELQTAGFKLEREEDHPHVYWSVPKTWFPGALAFNADEVQDSLRLLGRAPRGALRQRVMTTVVGRLANLGNLAGDGVDSPAVRPPTVSAQEEEWLSVLEDAAAKKVAVKMRYFSASRRDESWRHVSAHRVDLGLRPQLIATCHRAGELRRFRLSSVLDVKLDKTKAYRPVDASTLARFDDESFGGYRDDSPLVRCSFYVRDPESAWVARNLPDDQLVRESAPGGLRFTIETRGVLLLARFVVGLGETARAETPELAEEVALIARGALRV